MAYFFQKKQNFAVQEQILSDEEDNLKSLATKTPALEKPDLNTEGSEPLLLEAPDQSEKPMEFESDKIAPLKKKVSKPKSEKPIKDSLDVVTSEKLENISDLELSTPSEQSLKPSLTETRAEGLQVNLTDDAQSTNEFKSEQISKKHSRNEIIPNQQESFGIDKKEQVESAWSLDIPREPETDQADVQMTQIYKEIANVESKLEMEGTDELTVPSIETKRQRLKKKDIEKRDDSVHVETRESVEQTDDFKAQPSKGVKVKPKPSERRDSSVDVETRQQLETLVDTPPFMDDKKSEKLKPVSINERRESLNVQAKENLIESTDDILATAVSDESKIRPSSIRESKRESFKIQQQDEIESTTDIPITDQNLSEKIKPSTTREKRRSVSVTRPDMVEHAEDKSEDEKPATEKVRPTSRTPEKPSLNISSPKIHENVSEDSSSKLQEKERAVLKTSELKEPSLNVQDTQVKLEATDDLNDDVKPKKENIKPKSVKPEEIEYPVSVEKGPVKVEATDKVDQDQPKSQKIKSQKLPKKEKSLKVNQASTTKLETATNLEEEQPPKDQTKIKPKSVKDKKTSIEVKNVEESENAIPIVTDETRKIHISVEPWNKIEEIAPLEVLDKDKIETAEDYIVDEPVTPELAPGVTVQDNQAKASATSTGTTIEEIIPVTEKVDSIPETPKKKSTKVKEPIQGKDEEPVGGIKLKKAQTGKRELDKAEVEKISLKHHELERIPHEEEPEKETGVILSNPIMDDKKPKTSVAKPKKIEKRRDSVKVSKSQKLDDNTQALKGQAKSEIIQPTIEEEQKPSALKERAASEPFVKINKIIEKPGKVGFLRRPSDFMIAKTIDLETLRAKMESTKEGSSESTEELSEEDLLPKKENIKPKSLKPEEIEYSVGVEKGPPLIEPSTKEANQTDDKAVKPEKSEPKIVVQRKTPKVVKETQSAEETSNLKPGSTPVAELQKPTVNSKFACPFFIGQQTCTKSNYIYNHR